MAGKKMRNLQPGAKPKHKPRRGLNYPRAGKGAVLRWLPSWRVVLGSFITLIALGIGAFLGLYFSTEVPDPADFAIAQTTGVYYADGETKVGEYAEINRKIIDFTEIPEVMKKAVISSEDQNFEKNSGVSPKAIIRALINNLRGGERQGGSTLTQQYAERYYLGTTTSLFGKAKEAVLALKINNSQSKDQILGNYLNTIYFGRGAYGVEAAAKAYFGIPAAQLSLEQAALLTGIIPAPSAWDPAVNPDIAQKRYERVLRRMQEDEKITADEAQAALAAFPETVDAAKSNDFSGTNGYLLQQVRDELIGKADFTEDEVNMGGYRIITTVDKGMQEAAVAAVDSLPKSRPAGNRVGLISMRPDTGEIYAVYGGDDYMKRQRNAATQDRAQAGSTFKLFALVGALDAGVDLGERFPAPASMQVGGATFTNSGGVGYGSLDLIGMTKYSSNTGYINLNQKITPEKTKETAISMGLSADTPGLDDNLGNVLGSASVTAEEMARSYSVVANGGKLVTPHVVKEVRDAAGNVIYESPKAGERVIKSEVANEATYALRSVFSAGGTASGLGGYSRPFAGKTGTSTGPVSAWFVGYTPQMVTAVNMFQQGEDGSEQVLTSFGGVGTVFGSTFPADIWWQYTKVAMADMEKVEFPQIAAERRNKHRNTPQPTPFQEEQQNDPQHQQSNQPQPASPSHPDSPEPGDSNGHSQPNNPNQPGENPAAG